MTSTDGVTWTLRTTPDQTWNAIAWSPELSLFVVVALSGTSVMTSSNGTAWTTSTILENEWQSIVWAPELSLFVAVSSAGLAANKVLTSSNGTTWTTQTAPTSYWLSVCWAPELMLFVAVGASGTRVMTSSDGITWTSQIAAALYQWTAVCWSPELGIFVAVAQTGVGNRVMTSPNGVSWTARTSATDNNWYGVCWAPELSIFVAIALSGVGNRVMTSHDGITWTSRTSAADNNWRSVCWAPELSSFVAVGESGAGNRVMTSAIGMPNSKSIVKALPSQVTVFPNGNVVIGGGGYTIPSITTIYSTVANKILTLHSGLPNVASSYATVIGAPILSLGGPNWNPSVPWYCGIGFGYASVVDSKQPAEIGFATRNNSGGTFGDFYIATRSNGTESDPPVERLTVTSGGNVGIGKTNPTYKLHVEGSAYVTGSTNDLLTIRKNGAGGNPIWIIVNSDVATQSSFLLYFTSASTTVGTISTSGTTTAYNTTSDYRLKNNIRPLTNAMSTVSQLKPCTWTWKSNGTSGQGFIAHELQEVAPECVTGTKDEVKEDGTPAYQGVDNSFLIAILTSAIQELKNELDTLKVRVNELEGGGSAI
jgi:hypothetical protein